MARPSCWFTIKKVFGSQRHNKGSISQTIPLVKSVTKIVQIKTGLLRRSLCPSTDVSQFFWRAKKDPSRCAQYDWDPVESNRRRVRTHRRQEADHELTTGCAFVKTSIMLKRMRIPMRSVFNAANSRCRSSMPFSKCSMAAWTYFLPAASIS